MNAEFLFGLMVGACVPLLYLGMYSSEVKQTRKYVRHLKDRINDMTSRQHSTVSETEWREWFDDFREQYCRFFP